MGQVTSAQHDTIASASSSSCPASTSHGPYDVFINHRGPDVKNTFARHLYRALKSRGLQVFLDQPELEPGHIILSQIKAAIQNASVHVAIFSPAYADSNWCLDELVLMLASSGTILPVFYKVKPSDLRWPDKGAYAKALRQHEKKKRYNLETIEKWKRTLFHVADISGFELEACNGDEVDLLDQVVERILKEVPRPPLFVAKYKIGLQEKLEDFESAVLSQLVEEQRREAKVVGVVGSGGIGKSTLTREFFNRQRSNYNVSSFLFDVREKAATKSLTSLQSQLIKDLKDQDIQIKSWEEGTGILEKQLKNCHALVILDDVDHRNQLQAFLPIKNVLDPRSLILVTSRNKQVLQSEGIVESSIYQLKGLDRPNSLELFCWHAFFQPHPLPEFQDLANGFVKACDGLPLSLEVFGAMLCGENEKSNWKEQLNGLQKLPREIQARLRISYDSLEPEEQQIFLDIACFSIGQDKDKWIRIWGGSGWKGSVGLRILENKCLVEVDSQNKIRMHDHLRDLGRNIAQEESMPRRLWDATIKDVYDLLEQASSATIVRGIRMAPRYIGSNKRFSDTWEGVSFGDELFRISKLQLLEVEGNFVESILRKVRSPNLNLIWLCWKNCPCSDLPSWLPMHHLRVLEVKGGNLERLWERESQAPLQLRELNIVNASLLEIPNSIGKLQHLEKFALEYNWGYSKRELETLPEELCRLRSLKYFKLQFFSNLQILPSYFGNFTNLQYIDLHGCKNLQTLPPSFCNLTNLQGIYLSGSESLEVLPDAFRTLANLRKISLSGCKRLKLLPNSIEYLTNLQEMYLSGCESLEVLPDAFRTLSNLQEISLYRCKRLKLLPNSIEYLTNLQEMDLSNCESLEVLPDAFRTLATLQKISLWGCKRLKMLPNSIEYLTNLQEMDLRDCESLEVLPDAFRTLATLQKISLSGCKRLKMLPNSIEYLTNLQEMYLSDCESLEVLPDAFRTLANLQKISLSGCERLKLLPNSIKYLTNLQEMDLSGCESLEVLPDAFRTLANLQKISLPGCKILKLLLNSIEYLTNLQEMDLSDCGSLEVLPDAFGTLTNLRKINLPVSLKMLPNCIENLINLRDINLESCKILQVLPKALGALTNLYKIDLAHCISLKTLPNAFETLTNLQWIDLTDCISLKMLPNSIESLTNLRWIKLAGCLSLETLPNNFGNLTNLQYLDTSRSYNLQMPSNLLGNLLKLKHLHLSYCWQLIISNETLGNITKLKCLDLSGCLQLEVLPLQVLHQRSLRKLNLLNTNIKELPRAPMVCLSSLEVLLLGSPLLRALPPWLGQLTSLKKLQVHGSRKLKCLPNSVGQLAQLEELHISKCGIQYLPPDVMKMNKLKTLRILGCPLRELPFKKVEGEGEASLLTESPLAGIEVDSSIDGGMIRLKVLHLYLTEISEVSFPEGVCPNLEELKIRWCNDLVEAGALPPTLRKLDLRGCGALRKIGGLWSLAKLEEVDMRGCCTLQVEEVRGHESVISLEVLRTTLRSLNILKTPFETYDTNEKDDEEVQMMEDLHRGDSVGNMFYYNFPSCGLVRSF